MSSFLFKLNLKLCSKHSFILPDPRSSLSHQQFHRPLALGDPPVQQQISMTRVDININMSSTYWFCHSFILFTSLHVEWFDFSWETSQENWFVDCISHPTFGCLGNVLLITTRSIQNWPPFMESELLHLQIHTKFHHLWWLHVHAATQWHPCSSYVWPEIQMTISLTIY